jgi:hypothetical protein
LVYTELDVVPFKIIRSNCEELVIQGPESKQDLRIVNSYPSKVSCSLKASSPTLSYHQYTCETPWTPRP